MRTANCLYLAMIPALIAGGVLTAAGYYEGALLVCMYGCLAFGAGMVREVTAQ